MPDPTREQFNAAAKKVIGSAPPGLTRDQLLDLIDKELKSDPNTFGTVIGNTKGDVTPKPVPEDPSAGGFGLNVAKDAIETAGGIGEGLAHIVRHPIDSLTEIPMGVIGRIKDVASDMHPGQALDAAKKGNFTEALGQLLPVGEAYHRPVQMAADVAAARSIGGLAKSVKELPQTLKNQRDMSKVDRYMPNKSVDSPQRGIRILDNPADKTPVGYDRYMPNKSASNDTEFGRPEHSHRATEDPTHLTDESGRDLGTATAGAAPRPAGPWDGNAPGEATVHSLNKIAEDTLHEELMGKLGGGTEGKPAPRPPEPDTDQIGAGFKAIHDASGRGWDADVAGLTDEDLQGQPRVHDPVPASKWPPEGGHGDWHAFEDDASRKAAPQSERDSARALHKDTGEMDSRYDYLTDPNNEHSAFMGPEALFMGLARDLVREQLRKLRAGTANAGPVRKAATYGAEAVKTGVAAGNVGRIIKDK